MAQQLIPPPARTVTIDFETFWDVGYTLTSMSTSEYVRDKKFKVHCAAIKIGNRGTKVIWGQKEVGAFLRTVDWSTHGLLAQNTAFDGFILAEIYGILPCFYFDTKSMAAGLHNGVVRNSLKVLAPLYGMGEKLDNSLHATKGMATIPKEWVREFTRYNKSDTEQCWGIFCQQIEVFPRAELHVIDLVIRMFCDSQLLVNEAMAREGLSAELSARRSEILKTKAIYYTKGTPEYEAFDPEPMLMSNDKFAEALGKFVDVPTKISPTTGDVDWALAQSDEAFTEMQNHEDERVALLVRGRLAAKSKQAEMRAYRLLEAGAGDHHLPVGYTYSAALTHRFGGTNKLNLQNLPRVNPNSPQPSDALRRSIIAPVGHVLVVCDSAQIEARTLAWLAGQESALKIFSSGEDAYKHMAAMIYGTRIEDVTEDQRFIGKIAVLGLGYGMGHLKFQTTLHMGLMGPAVDITLAEAKRIVNLYRSTNNRIVAAWKQADVMLTLMQEGQSGGMFSNLLDYDATSVWLPNGLPIHYPQLERNETGDLTYNTLKGRRKIYGGKCIENLVQALARIIVVEQMMKINQSLPIFKLKKQEVARVCLMTHDEVVCVVPERYADLTLGMMVKEMRTAPEWCADLPLGAKGGYAANYSK